MKGKIECIHLNKNYLKMSNNNQYPYMSAQQTKSNICQLYESSIFPIMLF